ncbi:MAG: rRNA adenine N-6-methyltransferase family protein [Pseudonocardiaceae bacterium]
MTNSASESLRRLVDELSDSDSLAPWWRASFLAVPRQLFIPNTIWREVGSGDLVAVSRSDDPGRWRDLVEGNDAVITQVDDGHPSRPGSAGWVPTSSASMPKMVAVMLKHLDVQPGHRVLEIGTGTGWNTALLAHLLGAEQVTSIEIDPDLATHARTALSDAGFGAVVVISGDGTRLPAGCPVRRGDRHCGLSERAVCLGLAQTRPGGRIVTPWGNPYFDGGLLTLTASTDGAASGRIVGKSSFMYLRDQRIPRGRLRDILGTAQQRAATSGSPRHGYQGGGPVSSASSVASATATTGNAVTCTAGCPSSLRPATTVRSSGFRPAAINPARSWSAPRTARR